MSTIFLANARIVDGTAPEPSAPQGVVIEGDRIREVSPGARAPAGAVTIDLTGRVLMPGLIDCHVHTVAGEASSRTQRDPAGFTGDGALHQADGRDADARLHHGARCRRRRLWPGRWRRRKGLFHGPRLVFCGKALCQSGGHGDFRGPFDNSAPRFSQRLGALGRLCDGVHEVRKAAREEIKGGARFIKIMANGGVASPTDPIHFLGFSREILASVEEARNAGTYVAAHLYTDEGIRRAVECGVHSLEHCNLITTETARFAAEQGAIACPTLVTYDALSKEGEALGSAPRRSPRWTTCAWREWNPC